jgi:hypothetical protein
MRSTPYGLAENPRVFDLIHERLRQNPPKTQFQRIVDLLEGFENRRRPQVVGCVLRSWALFQRYDLRCGVEILSRYSIPGTQLRREAVAKLETLLDGPLSETARKGIERLLA